jgi:hypothetical protein
MKSVGEERNEYRSLFLWLMQYGTGGKCPSSCCKDPVMIFELLVYTYIYLQMNTLVLSLSEQKCITGLALLTLQSQTIQKVVVCHVPNCIKVQLPVWL